MLPENISENVEEYLETIYRLIERDEKLTTNNIARELGFSAPSVSEMLKKLDRMGFIKYKPYREVSLTQKGRRLGRTVLRKHRLIERFLEGLGISKHRVHHEACKLEHSVSDEVERALKRETEKKTYKRGVVTLHDMRPGQEGEIVSIDSGFHAKRRLEDLGLTPGAVIRVLRVAPLGGPVEILIRGSRLAIGRGMSRKVLVMLK